MLKNIHPTVIFIVFVILIPALSIAITIYEAKTNNKKVVDLFENKRTVEQIMQEPKYSVKTNTNEIDTEFKSSIIPLKD